MYNAYFLSVTFLSEIVFNIIRLWKEATFQKMFCRFVNLKCLQFLYCYTLKNQIIPFLYLNYAKRKYNGLVRRIIGNYRKRMRTHFE